MKDPIKAVYYLMMLKKPYAIIYWTINRLDLMAARKILNEYYVKEIK